LTLLKSKTETNSRHLAKYTMAVAVKMTGVAAHRIRKFENSGLCKPARTPSNQRLYSDEDIELIRQIGSLDRDGVNLPGIRVILNMQKANI
jgi:MerR family transcriptional regulator, heat shock protein HspR